MEFYDAQTQIYTKLYKLDKTNRIILKFALISVRLSDISCLFVTFRNIEVQACLRSFGVLFHNIIILLCN